MTEYWLMCVACGHWMEVGIEPGPIRVKWCKNCGEEIWFDKTDLLVFEFQERPKMVDPKLM
jgi:hypothetical protein